MDFCILIKMNNKSIFYAVFSLILMACSGGANWEKNNLGASHSPYLLQHADNPVHWQEWSEAAFETAKSQNKLVLVSVGYAACHWCHVMERESFEDDSVAHLMNAHFINIKVDREERPEVDRALIDMAQKISGRAGWPLNVVLLPDGKPITAGTYFPKEHWLKLLSQITETWNENPDELRKLGDRIHRGLAYQKLTFEAERNNQADTAMIHDWMEKWSYQWDTINGGYSGTPKFPLPNDLMTFLNYGVLSGKRGFVTHTQNTVSKMLKGGIYDQLAGGFARYAIDSAWNIPHFEKMLYDNAQLLKIMAVLYQLTDEPKYRLGIEETWEWLSAMKSSEGGYYASLNAESEGEEGKYYVWQLDEVQKILGKATPWVSKYYGLTKAGNWDNGRNILFQAGSPEEICHEFDIDVSNWLDTLNWANEKLLERRQKREAPSTDRKIIAAWNALLINGFLHCYLATQDEKFLNESLIIADFLKNTMMNEKGEVWRSSFEGKRNIKAGLTDYAYLIDAFVCTRPHSIRNGWKRLHY
jgi:uncharacterized protein YyaL (SSP411 family)